MQNSVFVWFCKGKGWFNNTLSPTFRWKPIIYQKVEELIFTIWCQTNRHKMFICMESSLHKKIVITALSCDKQTRPRLQWNLRTSRVMLSLSFDFWDSSENIMEKLHYSPWKVSTDMKNTLEHRLLIKITRFLTFTQYWKQSGCKRL